MRRLFTGLVGAACALVGCTSSGGTASSPDAAALEASMTGDAAGLGDAISDGATRDGTVDARADGMAGCGALPDGQAPDPLLTYQLSAAAFPDASTPSVAVHIPPGFDPSNRPGVIVFFHGWDNCVTNVIGSVDSPCVDGGAPRVAMHLADQIDTARVNAILVAVELEVDMSTGDPGQLATPGDFAALLHELFTQHLDAVLGCPLDVASLDRVVLSSHSGGYWATANVLAMGGVSAVREVDLLDSLYGEIPSFYAWAQGGITRFDRVGPDGLRWMDVYTATGGTDVNSQTMATDMQGWLDEAGLGPSELDDRTTDTLDAGAYTHPVIFKLTDLTHDEVPQFYVERLARASGFATIP